jgi:hypothetical protein
MLQWKMLNYDYFLSTSYNGSTQGSRMNCKFVLAYQNYSFQLKHSYVCLKDFVWER